MAQILSLSKLKARLDSSRNGRVRDQIIFENRGFKKESGAGESTLLIAHVNALNDPALNTRTYFN